MSNIIRYFGKKDYDILPIIKRYGVKTYCEPFSGSFTTGLNAAMQNRNIRYVYNDIDYDVYNFWINAKNDIFKVLEHVNAIKLLIGNETELDEVLHIIMQYKENQNNTVVDAAVTYIMLNGRRFSANSNDKILKDLNINTVTALNIIRALEIVDIYNLDYKEIFNKVDSPDTLYLIDPPYYVRKVDSYYKSDCRTIYHKGIAEEIKKLKGKFILTYNINDYISSLYSEFNQTEMRRSDYVKDLVIWNFDMTEDEIYKVCKFSNLGIYELDFDIDVDTEDI